VKLTLAEVLPAKDPYILNVYMPGVVSPKKLYVKLEAVNVTPLGNVPILL